MNRHQKMVQKNIDASKFMNPSNYFGNINDYLKLKESTADDEVKMLMGLLEEKTPFSFARFNDGEMGGIQQIGASIARGDQIVNETLHKKLIECMSHEQKNYFIGMPCGTCFPSMRKTANSIVKPDYKYKVKACCITNRNWLYFIKNFKRCLGNRKLNWICGDNQKMDVFYDWGIELDKVIEVPSRNSWSIYDKLVGIVDSFNDGDVIGLSCGPISRILAKEWFEINPTLTLMDIGSGTDPFTKPWWGDCHVGWIETGFNITNRCPECN